MTDTHAKAPNHLPPSNPCEEIGNRSIRSIVFMVLSALFILMGAPLLAQADAGERVITTDRLNLRSCPDTSGCQVLRTLPLDTSLIVVDRRNEWLQVTVPEDGASGWVHARYTRAEERPSSFSLSKLLSRESLVKLLVALCLACSLLVTARVAPSLKRGFTASQFLTLAILSVLLGVVVLLNQFGPILADLAYPYLELGKVSFLWEINAVVENRISYSHVALFLAAIVAGVALVAPAVNGHRVSFLQGVGTGLFTLPAMAVALVLATVAGYIIILVFKLIGFLVSIIVIPFVWLWTHILLPVLRFLATPLVWLWENVLREIVQFLAIPFVWLWRAILQPVFGFLFKFVLVPLFLFVVGMAASLLALFPFAVVGAMVLESLRNATRGSLNTFGLFSQGVTVGFLLFDTALLAGLTAFDLLHTAPPLSLLVPVALQVVVLVRLLGQRSAAAEEASPVFQDKLRSYWKTSPLELLATCVMVPVGLFALFYGEDS